ncbi:P-type Ca2+ transporter type 2B [Entomortierella parvispora]|uniref:Calcium-transporting ATPase n=1 Tax=Entomortierella parvispora TaxID=205924 RepID=A0A9P3LSE5_9FUNG|nr:P-type Ca2+ transporter type 2B [Entomortierella parvispora]
MGTTDLDSSKTEIQPAYSYELKDSNSPASGSIDTPAMHDHDHSDTTATAADPRPANNGRFAFTSDELMDLVDPKSPATLVAYGGVQGVLAGLHANPTKGLSTSDRSLSAVVTSDENEKVDSPEGASTLTGPVTIAEREQFFGRNVLPKRKPKTIFQLMWMALQEKILILLLVAAVVSIALGLYEDYGMPHPEKIMYDKNFNPYTAEEPKISWVEGVAILVAVMIVVMVGSVNDYQKEAQFRKLNAKKEDREVKVLRNGETVLISVFDIVVGDVLHLEPGDVISVDGVYLGGHNLKCDESAMTGESDAVKKVTFEEYLRLEEIEAATHNEAKIQTNHEGIEVIARPAHDLHGVDPFIISGSKVLEGVGLYVVTGVGENSFHGRTMMSLRTDPEDTPLQVKLNHLAEQIAKLGSLAALLMLIVLFIRFFVSFKTKGTPSSAQIVQQLVDILIAAVTVIVVAVPEGLPLAVTLALAFATTRMLRDNNLVRVLAACETMGNATTICSDKTGTLTQNRMTIVSGTLGINTRFIADVAEGDSNPRASIPINKHAVPMNQLVNNLPSAITQLLHEAIAINSSAFESEDDKGELAFIGSKTEVAMLDFSKRIGGADYRRLREAAPVVHLYPFSSERKSMATIVQMGPKQFRLHAKGASEIIMKRCNKVVQISSSEQGAPLSEKDRSAATTELDLNDELQTQIHKTIISYATQSLRTIGIAYRDFESWPPANIQLNADGEVPFSEVAESGMTLVGIVGIEDPLREGVPEAVLACQRAGVFVRMVTGDNILTAKSIATQCGIYTQGGIIMEGPKFRALSGEEMDAVIPRLQVLARSSPEDKKILVGRLKALGEIVAVTGDGTNDGPALKMSDVGFSMGIAGTEVAKEASSIILMDDNFSSIVKAISWGRTVNDAVKKFLQFQLTVNVTAVILTFVTAVASDNQTPVMSAVQLLWINLIMDTLAALALATDPPTPELLERQPEPRSAPLINFTMWKMILGQSILQLVITFVLEYAGMDILNYDEVPEYLKQRNDPATNSAYTAFKRQELDAMVFNTFVFLQIFNEVNCRRLDNNLNIFSGAIKNRYFSVIFVIMVVLQILIIEFGGAAFKTQSLDGVQWLICVLLGLLSIPVGVMIRLTPDGIFGGIKDWVNNSSPVQSGLPNFESYPANHEMGRVNSIPVSVGSHHRTNSLTGSINNNVYPSRDGLVWNSAITKVRSELSVFKSIRGGRLSTDSEREHSHVLHAGAMVPSLVATSVGAGWQPHRVRDITPGNSSSQVNIQSSPRSSISSRRGTGASASSPPPAASSSSTSAPVHNLTSQSNLSGITLPIS